MRKRILFLTPQFPYPPQQGTAIRNYNLIRQLASEHEVYLVSFRDGQVPVDPGPLGELCAEVLTAPLPKRTPVQRFLTLFRNGPDMAHRLASLEFGRELGSLLARQKMDVLQIEGLEMAPYARAVLRLLRDNTPLLVYDAHNAEYLLQQRIFQSDARLPRRWVGAAYSWLQANKLRRYEARICLISDHVIACSPADAQALQHIVPGLEPLIIPNGVDTEEYLPGIVPPAALGEQALVFTGKMDFRPNVDAMLWFCDQVWPRIREAAPAARMYIVGKNPHARLQRLGGIPGVTFTGFVEDVRPYIAAAAVYVVPLLTGGGTRLKILEAMAMGKAIVSTTLGAEGIDAPAGEAIAIADGADAFAQTVVRLIGDAQGRERLGAAARAFVEQHFDWRTVTRPLLALYDH